MLCAGCLPLAVDTARYKVPKVLLGERVSHIDDKIVTELQFVRVKYKTCEMSVTERNHTFMHLNTIDKFLYIQIFKQIEIDSLRVMHVLLAHSTVARYVTAVRDEEDGV